MRFSIRYLLLAVVPYFPAVSLLARGAEALQATYASHIDPTTNALGRVMLCFVFTLGWIFALICFDAWIEHRNANRPK